MRKTLFLVLMFAAVLIVVPAPQAQTPIPSGPTNLPDYIGAPAKAWPVANSRVPQNPYLGLNPYGAVHLDSWNSDTADIAGPLGREPVVWSSTLAPARQYTYLPMGATQAFDSHGRPVAVCIDQKQAVLVLVDPVSLEVLSQYELVTGSGLEAIGSAYFYVDSQDQAVIAKGADQIVTLRIGGTKTKPEFEEVPGRQYGHFLD